MGPYNVFYNCQSEPGSAHFAAAGFINAIEAFEYTFLMLIGNTDAVITDRYAYIPFEVAVAGNPDFGVRTAVFNGIINKIDTGLHHELGIDMGLYSRFAVRRKGNPAFVRAVPAGLYGLHY